MSRMNNIGDIVIGPIRFRVEVSDIKDIGSDSYGVTIKEKQKIIIASDLGDDVAIETLFHEILHAVLFVSGADYNMSDDEEESLISSISPYIVQILKSNKKLLKLIGGIT